MFPRLLFAASLALPLAAKSLTPAWVELGPRGALARIVIDAGSSCPDIKIDGASAPMSVRPRVEGMKDSDYPIGVCETEIPAAAKKASVGGQKLVLPTPGPKRVVLIGDTGCRIKGTEPGGSKPEMQDCLDPKKWPFQALATQAASEKPQLILHVGDYLYRETPCTDPALCGTVHGYNWPTWMADFFTPAADLLKAAPWVFARGNHEDCSRAWQGYFYILDPRPVSEISCKTGFTAPYVARLGKLAIGVLDSSSANDTKAKDVAEFSKELRAISADAGAAGWLLSHKPIFGVAEKSGKMETLNATLEAAWKDAAPKNLPLLINGHTHLFEILSFKDGPPIQAVIGDSGTRLAKPLDSSQLPGFDIAGRTVASANSFDSFAYGLMTPAGDGWRLRMRSKKGNNKVDCQLTPSTGAVACK